MLIAKVDYTLNTVKNDICDANKEMLILFLSVYLFTLSHSVLATGTAYVHICDTIHM